MTHLSLDLLGPVQIALDGQPIADFDYTKVRALLVYLAVERERSHQRDTIAELLWPEQAQQVGRSSLRQALAKLRQAIRDADAAPPFLLITRESLQFNRASSFAIDVALFEALVAAGERHRHGPSDVCDECVKQWEQAAALHRGPFLDQAVPRDSVGFEEWVLVRRERYERQARAMLDRLATHYETRGNDAAALRHARRHLELDPWNEAAHRQVMRLLARSGQRSAALAQYAHCRRVIEEDLGVEPEEETIALYEQIRRDTSARRPAAAPAAAEPAAAQLPAQPTAFVGRESELDELGALLAEPTCRLITLLGPGGIGKTRLALRAAELYGPTFAQGACWAPLADLAGLDQLPAALARALGLALDEAADTQRQLITFLADRELLLLLDNFEHLLDGADLLAALLAGAPRVKLLITSRERLQLQWEWLLDVRGLPYPTVRRTTNEIDRNEAVDDRWPAGELERYSAVRLFLDRARQVRRGAALTAADRQSVVRICQIVEGMPLALELAATASRELPYAEIGAALAGSLDILQAALRDRPERHRSIRAAFEYSWRMLPAAEQQILARLAAFRGSFAAAAAAEIAGADAAQLDALADRSLLLRVEDGRFAIHALIRQFAAEKLAAAGDTARARDRHLAHFVAMAEQAEPQLRGAEQPRWLELIEYDHDNLRAALEWSLQELRIENEEVRMPSGQRGDQSSILNSQFFIRQELGLRLAGALWRFWWIRGYVREGRQWLERALEIRDQTLEHKQANPLSLAVAKALNGLGALVEEQGGLEQAAAHYAASLALFRSAGDVAGSSSALNNLGGALYKQGQFARAIEHFSEAAEIDRARGDRYGTAVALHNLASAIYDSGGDIGAARALLAECLDIWEQLGMRMGTATTLSSLGQLALIQQDHAAAASYFEHSAAVLRELGDLRSTSLSLTGLGRALHRQGENTAALAAYREAIGLRHELGEMLGVAECCEGLGEVALAQRAPARTLRLYATAAAIREAIGSPVLPVDQQAYDETLAAARAQLDPAEQERIWQAGHALTLEAAVAYALAAGHE